MNKLELLLKNCSINGLKEVLKEVGSNIEGQSLIRQIALNYIINKYYAKDLFIAPQKYFKHKEGELVTKDIIKRSAGSVAMHVGLGESRMEVY
mgnify:CR=1 FL=1